MNEYPITINQRDYSWPKEYITGAQIKELASIDGSHGVWMLSDAAGDPPIEDDGEVLLGRGSVRIFTGPRSTTQGSGSAVPSGVQNTDGGQHD